MFPPAPAPPMARPVPLKLSDHSSPPPMQVSPPPSDSPHPALREVRLSPSPLDLQSGGRTVFYTYSGGGTIALSDALSPPSLSVVQPPRSSGPLTAPSPSRPAPAIRWTTSTGSFISDMESSSIAYDLMTPMISSSSLQLQDDPRYFSTQLEPMDATVGGVGLSSQEK